MQRNKLLSLLSFSGMILSANVFAGNVSSSLQTTASVESLCVLSTLNDVEFPLPLTPPASGSFAVPDSQILNIECNQNFPSNINYNIIGSAFGGFDFDTTHGYAEPTFTNSMIPAGDGDGFVLGLATDNKTTTNTRGTIKVTNYEINLFVKYPLNANSKPLYVAPGTYQWSYEISVNY